MKIPHEEAARQIGYHVQSLRLDARVFRRRHDVSEAVNLYEMHKDEIAFRPRKNDGVDFDRDCLRLLDAARNVAGKTDDGQWLEPTVDDVVAASTALVPVGGTRPPQAVSADQKMLRWASIAGYCLAVMAQRGIKTALGDFENIEQLEKAVTETMWDKETDLALFDHVKGQPFDTMNVGMADEAAEPFAGRLIDHATKANEEEEHPKKKAASGKTGNGRKKAGNGRRKKQAAPVETTSTEPTPTEPTPTAPDDTTGEG
jgi:hypothetical protein